MAAKQSELTGVRRDLHLNSTMQLADYVGLSFKSWPQLKPRVIVQFRKSQVSAQSED